MRHKKTRLLTKKAAFTSYYKKTMSKNIYTYQGVKPDV